jgi:hypothetical protein
MESAFVLINCDLGSENSVINELNHLNGVKEVHGTYGIYDIIAKVESEKPETLKRTITDQIRKLHHITSTLTLIETENDEETSQADLIPDVVPEEKKPLEPPEEIDEDDEDEDDEDEDYDEDEDHSQKKKRYNDPYKKRYRDQV